MVLIKRLLVRFRHGVPPSDNAGTVINHDEVGSGTAVTTTDPSEMFRLARCSFELKLPTPPFALTFRFAARAPPSLPKGAAPPGLGKVVPADQAFGPPKGARPGF